MSRERIAELEAALAQATAERDELKCAMHDDSAKYFTDRAAWRTRAEAAESALRLCVEALEGLGLQQTADGDDVSFSWLELRKYRDALAAAAPLVKT